MVRRVEAGESFEVTVSGRVVANLTPVRPRTWVTNADLADLWASPAWTGFERDGLFDDDLRDPFAERPPA